MPALGDFRAQFERLGVEVVRANVANGQYRHSPPLNNAAIDWLGEKEAEAHSRSEAARAQEMELARAARDAAVAANELAREANEIARDASASASRSADAARTNNKIAAIALIVAMAAIAISIIGILTGK